MILRLRHDLHVDDTLREELAGPFGKVTRTKEFGKKHKERIYAVGDATVRTLLELGYRPKLSIFDYRTGHVRRRFAIINRVYKNPINVKNKRGTLSVSLWNAVRDNLKYDKKGAIHVYGEEDLGALACIYFAKKGDLVVYGIRGKGMDVIKIEKNIKSYVAKVLARMSKLKAV